MTSTPVKSGPGWPQGSRRRAGHIRNVFPVTSGPGPGDIRSGVASGAPVSAPAKGNIITPCPVSTVWPEVCCCCCEPPSHSACNTVISWVNNTISCPPPGPERDNIYVAWNYGLWQGQSLVSAFIWFSPVVWPQWPMAPCVTLHYSWESDIFPWGSCSYVIILNSQVSMRLTVWLYEFWILFCICLARN